MSNRGLGGRYVIGPDGERVLVERTDWTPAPVSPAAEHPETPYVEDSDHVLEEEIPAGED